LLILAAALASYGQSVVLFGGAYSQNFDGLATNHNSAISSPASLDGPFPLDDLSWASPQPYTNYGMTGWQLYETGGTGQAAFSVNDGSSSTSFCFSYGTINSTERALGVLAGGARRMAVGLVLQNVTGATLNEVTVSFTGEQWRLGRSGAANPSDALLFEYRVGSGTDLSTNGGAFTAFQALNFFTPITTGTIGALDGNAAAYRVALSSSIAGLGWAEGQYLVLRWRDVDDAGSDHGMGIDELSITTIPEPSMVSLVVVGGMALGFRRWRRSSR
jgi:hypothetical protein